MNTVSRVAPAVTAFDNAPPAGRSYEVQRGDTLDRIAADQGLTLDALLAANPLLRDTDLLHVGERLYLPEPLSDGVADLMPEPTHGLLHAVPLLALYRLDPTWRRDTYQEAVRLQSLILSADAPRQDDAPEGMPLPDARSERTVDRRERNAAAQGADPRDAVFDADNARDRRSLQRDGLVGD